MRRRAIVAARWIISFAALGLWIGTASADGNINAVNHIIIIMQENHSFDNYFGVLPYVPGGPYHQCRNQDRESPFGFQRTSDMDGGGDEGGDGDRGGDHQCVDGLTCLPVGHGNIFCFNFNFDQNFRPIFSFHDDNYCPGPDLQHDWQGSHMEANLFHPECGSLFLAQQWICRRQCRD